MKTDSMTVHVKLDAAIFRRFAMFDTFRRQRRWVSPAVFSGIMSFFSAIAFTRIGISEQAMLIGCVLLGVGFVLPIVYYFNFFYSLQEQINQMGLLRPKFVYTLDINQSGGIAASTEKEHVYYSWSGLYNTYRTKDAIYLYVAPHKAFLLPESQIKEGADALWHILTTSLPVYKCHDIRKGSPTK